MQKVTTQTNFINVWVSLFVTDENKFPGDLRDAIKANTTLKFGLYHSLYEWYNPLWMRDRDNNRTTRDFVEFKVKPEMYEIVS